MTISPTGDDCQCSPSLILCLSAQHRYAVCTMHLKPIASLALNVCAIVLLQHLPRSAQAQAGPPFLSNDPGTPGNANWEINLASMQTIVRGLSTYEGPQIDLNFGLGDRIQLTFEIPYVVQTGSGLPNQSGWGNAYPGVKWSFLDQGE